MENNQAFVATLQNIQPIPGADKIVQADVVLNGIAVTAVIVGADTQENTEVVYFDSNMCIEPTTVLVDYPELGRYLAKNGRVKTIKLRGVYSDGLAVESYKFYRYFDTEKDAKEFLVPGQAFTDIGQTHICHKYFVPAKTPSMKKNRERGGKKTSRLVEGQFHFHIDTDQLARNIHELNPEDVVSISRKVHGTSSICSRVLVKRKQTVRDHIARLFGISVPETEYDVLYSSRRVVKNDAPTTGYYKVDIWRDAGEKYFADKLHDGETVYFEIIGWLPNGSPIQKHYNYGYDQGEYGVRVYRMTHTSPDGHVVEYSWPTLKARTEEMGVEMVTEYYYGTLSNLFPEIPVDDEWRSNLLEALKEKYLDKKVSENIGKKVPDEGIVVKVEDSRARSYKLKDLAFLQKEILLYEEGAENMEDEG